MNQLQMDVTLWDEVFQRASSDENILQIAMESAGSSLGKFVGRPFQVEDVRIKELSFTQLTSYTNLSETETVAIYVRIFEDLPGWAVFILPLADALYLVDWLLELKPLTTHSLDSLATSALAEIGNIVLTSFLNAISKLTQHMIRPSPPAVSVDMLATVLEVIVSAVVTITDKPFIIETNFVNVDHGLAIQFWVLPHLDMKG